MLRLTRAQVREVDRIAIREFGVPGIVLMENAARGAADVAMQMLAGAAQPFVAVVCGTGNNGGDGMAMARHLHNRGVRVEVILARIGALSPDAATNHRIIATMQLPIHDASSEGSLANLPRADLVVDALFGTGLTRPIDAPWDGVVTAINSGRVLAIDIPSGLDCDTGEPLGPACVRAERTVTFVAEKVGFANPRSRQFTGEVFVADIGAPAEIVGRVL